MLGHGRAVEDRPWTPPRTIDRDLVNRTGLVIGMAFWLIGMTGMIALPWIGAWASLPEALVAALAFDPGFLAWRAPWVLILWAASFALHAVVLVAGRWTRDTRRISTGLNLAWLALIGWWLGGGRIMQSDTGDEAAKAGLLVIVLLVLIDLFVTWRRHAARLRSPVG